MDLCSRETRQSILYIWNIECNSRIDLNACSNESMDSSTKTRYVSGIQKDNRIKRIVIEWAQRIYVVERRIELFHGEHELGEEAKTKNITGKDM
jgi:hypothetical protein